MLSKISSKAFKVDAKVSGTSWRHLVEASRFDDEASSRNSSKIISFQPEHERDVYSKTRLCSSRTIQFTLKLKFVVPCRFHLLLV